MPGFDPGLVLRLPESEGGTMSGGVPTMLAAQLDHPDFVRRVEAALDAPMSITFAQTEASPSITQSRLDDSPADRAETLGRRIPRSRSRSPTRATGERWPAGAGGSGPGGFGPVGEIVTRGYHVMKEYFDDPAATGATIDADGWLHTGDLGSADERAPRAVHERLLAGAQAGARRHGSGPFVSIFGSGFLHAEHRLAGRAGRLRLAR